MKACLAVLFLLGVASAQDYGTTATSTSICPDLAALAANNDAYSWFAPALDALSEPATVLVPLPPNATHKAAEDYIIYGAYFKSSELVANSPLLTISNYTISFAYNSDDSIIATFDGRYQRQLLDVAIPTDPQCALYLTIPTGDDTDGNDDVVDVPDGDSDDGLNDNRD